MSYLVMLGHNLVSFCVVNCMSVALDSQSHFLVLVFGSHFYEVIVSVRSHKRSGTVHQNISVEWFLLLQIFALNFQ